MHKILQYQGTPDGVVLTARIDTVKRLIIPAMNISDLTGIEDFIALTELECPFNQLSNLDLSNNIALTDLNCSFNQLTSLDLSQNTALTFLSCHVNQLTNLNVTQNNFLVALNCSDNQLTNLDVTQNPSLSSFDCFENQLTSLNITQNTLLVHLDMYENQLTNINLTQNVLLRNLNIHTNQLKSLDITQNVALVELGCSSNQLTNLNTSQNTLLETIVCADNQITSLNVSQNTNLTFFSCSFNQLNCLNIKNGNNSNLGLFFVNNNANLTCIEVDNVLFSNANWSNPNLYMIDPTAFYSNSCINPCNIVGIDDLERELSNILLYPNPTIEDINIKLNQVKESIDVTLINSLGQVIQYQQFEFTDFINFKVDAPKGFYFLKLKTSLNEIKTIKLFKV